MSALANGFARRKLARPLRRLPSAIALASMLAAIGGPAFAQGCTGQCADLGVLLSPFTSLLRTQGGLALLNANLQAEENIYLNSTQAQKVTAATNVLLPYMPANILIGAFPGNPNFGYSGGLPSAPPLPPSVLTAAGSILNVPQMEALKTTIGQIDIYGRAYRIPLSVDPNGDPAPFQVSSAIGSHPFTIANSSLLAYQVQQTSIGGWGQSWQSNMQSSAFPSGHAWPANIDAITYAILAPGYYQQLVQSGVDFGYSLNVYAFHYPLDVIAGRILATYTVAQTLAGNPLYPSASFTPGNLASLSQAMQTYLGGGGSSPYAAACAGNVAACVAANVIPTAAAYTSAREHYTYFLTYNLPSVGDTTLAPVVPADAYRLIATRFPYLSKAQLDQILATTELPSGVPLDNGSGWARLNLYAAAGGYGAFAKTVTVNMNAALGGFNAFDIWSNNISGSGGLILQGTGTLILAGNNSYSGGTEVQGGTLAVTGTLGGDLTIRPGATFISNGGYAVAGNATLANAGIFIEVSTPLINAGTAGNTGAIVGDVSNSGSFSNNGIVTGAFSNSGLLSGNGVVGSLALLPGSTVAPGNSVGTIGVFGNLAVAPGATYRAEVGGNGADLIQVGGTATLSGGTVVAGIVIGTTPTLGLAYPILAANGGITGTFASANAGDLAFIQASLSYDADDVFLTLTRNGMPFAGVATTPNQVAVANAIGAGGSTSGPYMALISQSAAGARQAFDALSGEVHASVQTTMIDDSLFMREAVLGRLRQASFAGAPGPLAALGFGGPALAAASAPADAASAVPAKAPALAVPTSDVTWWSQGLGAWGRIEGDGDAAGAKRSLAGFFAGIDTRLGDNWRAGLAGGYTNASLGVSARASSASIDTAHLAAYAGSSYGAFNLRSGAAYAWSTIGTSRSIVFPGIIDSAAARYDAGAGQIFGEVGYAGAFRDVAIEPFAGLAYVHLDTGSFTEAGGSAALAGSRATEDVGYSSLGLRLATSVVLVNGMALVPRASVSWQHAFGDVIPNAPLAFAGTGAAFAIAGVPLARDAAVVEAGFDLRLTPRAKIGVSYFGQLAAGLQDHAVKGNLTWNF